MATTRTFDHPDRELIALDAVLSALADPVRRTIVRQLADGPDAQACSQFSLPVGASTRTHHFRVLREAGLIAQEYHGTAILSSLRTADLEARLPGVLDAVLASERAGA
ncbi:ArsR/SmtB family transcription factor [Nocardioides sp. URHA0020]|uniref:ArsR/SmtB family transcription factor n=1 Tax=Nocardioides sp. URHA0020 TaxID=1380392 RepID=UPI00048B2456|nr:helix-turn-helix transcriptional regulator [Nocardioides sp. URHA0020]